MTEQRRPSQQSDDREDIDRDPDFAEEHDMTWTEGDDGKDERETESPRGHGGLEPTKRPD